MAWLEMVPFVLFLSLIVALPGWVIARGLRLNIGYSLGFAPVLGLGAIGLWTLVWGGLGLPWGWGAIATLMAIALIGWILVIRYRKRSDYFPASSSLIKAQIIMGLAGVLTFSGIQLWYITQGMGAPDALPHLGDADFHLQGTKLVYETGLIFPVGALSELYDPSGAGSVYYPTLWHGLVALLLPFTDLVIATNATMLAVGLVFWPMGVATLGAALLPRNPYITFISPLFVSVMVMFPGTVGIAFSIYPFALSLTTLAPGIAALLLWQRTANRSFGVVYGFAVLAGVVAQPTVAILTVAFGGVALAVQYVRWAIKKWHEGTRAMPVLISIGLLTAGATAMVLMRHNAYLKALASYPRGPMTDQPVKAFFDGQVVAASEPWWPWIAIVALAAVGLLIQLKRPIGWTFLGIVLISALAFIASAGPDSTFRALTGPWYKDPLRLGAVAGMLTATAASVAVAWGVAKLLPRTPSLKVMAAGSFGVALVAVLVWVGVDPKISQVGQEHIVNGYKIDQRRITPIDTNSIPLMERLDDHFEAGERLLTPHGLGGGFIVAFSDMKPFIPTRELLTDDQYYLAKNLDQIMVDPSVCEIIRENNITAFMVDTGNEAAEITWGPIGAAPSAAMADGFELVDQEGTLKVWRITACD